jgi:hypothetical protein
VLDLIKDSLILPWAFICAKEQMSEQEFRQQCLQNFTKHKALDFMFQTIKEICALLALMIFCLKSSSNFVLGVMPLICKSLSLPQILFKKSMRLVWMVLAKFNRLSSSLVC